ncbi:hypothetical protein DB347_24595 [Opitutaceae bacterium EW11]|nr:hypothetical protein DB347_24595 [Opitutaceae bacterium EW11]
MSFALGLSLLTAVLSGLFPALRAGRVDPLYGLKSRGAAAPSRLRSGRILVAAQIAISLVLLTGAALFVRSLINLTHIDPGFRSENLLLVQLSIRGSGYPDAQPAEYYARVQDALGALPGVSAASLVEFPLLAGSGSSGGFNAFSHGAATGKSMDTRRLSVGETFFTTYGVPIVRGRALAASDNENAPKVIVVNETFVRKHLPDRDPIGLTIPVWDADWQIVGVCRDIKYSTIKEEIEPTSYFPFRQRFYSRFQKTHLGAPYFALRTVLPPSVVLPAARNAIKAIDPAVAVTNVTTQEAVRARGIGRETLFAVLCSSLAGIGLLLACLGLYGLMAFNVTRRTSEFGIRMALGADRRMISRLVLREAVFLTAVGLALAAPATIACAGLIQSQLYGVAPGDPWSLSAGSLLLIAVAVFAAWLPARRASHVNPLTALRAE